MRIIIIKNMITHPTRSSIRKYRTLALPAVVAVSTLLLTGCGGAAPAVAPDAAPASPESRAEEAQARTPRLVLTHDTGLTVLDSGTLKSVGGARLESFGRINPAGDGRHVLVSTGDAFRVFDAGVWTEAHGDHGHHYAAEPRLLDRAFAASKAGHVVQHAGRTVLFNDSSGKVESFDPSTLTESLRTGLPATDVYTTPEAHHGVAVGLPRGKLLVTLGNEKSRSGIAILDAVPAGGTGQDRKEIVRNEDCPGVHGEAGAAHGTVAVGCQNGMLIYKDGKITKVASPDAYGRMGNLAGSEESPVVLGEYKVDKAAKLERSTRISLVNTETGTLHLVDLGTSYSFRSLGRGPAGEALVLGTDGALHVIDPLSGAVTSTFPVVAAWEEPENWQEPRPTLFVQGSTAFVTEPASRTIHAVDVKTGKVATSAQLDVVPNELSGVDG